MKVVENKVRIGSKSIIFDWKIGVLEEAAKNFVKVVIFPLEAVKVDRTVAPENGRKARETQDVVVVNMGQKNVELSVAARQSLIAIGRETASRVDHKGNPLVALPKLNFHAGGISSVFSGGFSRGWEGAANSPQDHAFTVRRVLMRWLGTLGGFLFVLGHRRSSAREGTNINFILAYLPWQSVIKAGVGITTLRKMLDCLPFWGHG